MAKKKEAKKYKLISREEFEEELYIRRKKTLEVYNEVLNRLVSLDNLSACHEHEARMFMLAYIRDEDDGIKYIKVGRKLKIGFVGGEL